MNKDNIRTLINVLKQSNTFDMSDYRHDCGSPACIAGHVQSIEAKKLVLHYEKLVQNFLGVSKEQTHLIVNPIFKYANYSAPKNPSDKGYITKGHAIRMLERLLETGKVDWKGTKEKPSKSKDREKFDIKEWLKQIKPGVESRTSRKQSFAEAKQTA